MSVPANDNNAIIPVTCMSRECALLLGAKPIRFDAAGKPLPFVPPRVVIIVHAHWIEEGDDRADWMYWDFVPDQPELPEPKEDA